jgi:hypothetical protein
MYILYAKPECIKSTGYTGKSVSIAVRYLVICRPLSIDVHPKLCILHVSMYHRLVIVIVHSSHIRDPNLKANSNHHTNTNDNTIQINNNHNNESIHHCRSGPKDISADFLDSLCARANAREDVCTHFKTRYHHQRQRIQTYLVPSRVSREKRAVRVGVWHGVLVCSQVG